MPRAAPPERWWAPAWATISGVQNITPPPKLANTPVACSPTVTASPERWNRPRRSTSLSRRSNLRSFLDRPATSVRSELFAQRSDGRRRSRTTSIEGHAETKIIEAQPERCSANGNCPNPLRRTVCLVINRAADDLHQRTRVLWKFMPAHFLGEAKRRLTRSHRLNVEPFERKVGSPKHGHATLPCCSSWEERLVGSSSLRRDRSAIQTRLKIAV